MALLFALQSAKFGARVEIQTEFWNEFDRFPFGDGPELADKLLSSPVERRRHVGAGRLRAVLQAIELTPAPRLPRIRVDEALPFFQGSVQLPNARRRIAPV